jgi:hypothetical protein
MEIVFEVTFDISTPFKVLSDTKPLVDMHCKANAAGLGD